MSFRIIMENMADSATLSADPDFAADLSLTGAEEGVGIQRSERCFTARTVGLPAVQRIYFSLPEARVVANDGFVLQGNFSSDAVIKISLYPGAVQAGETILDTEPEGVWKLIPWEDFLPWGSFEWGASQFTRQLGVDPQFTQAFTANNDGDMYQSGVIEVYDAANPAGFIDVNRFFLGAWIQPQRGASFGATVKNVDDSELEPDDGAGLKGFEREKYRKVTFDLNGLKNADFSALWAGFNYCGKTKEIYVDVRPNQIGTQKTIWALRGHFVSEPEFNKATVNHFRTRFEIREVK